MRSDDTPRNPRASDIDRAIAARIREARISKGLSQIALADQIGVTYQQFQKYEKGLNRISAARLFSLARALDLPTSGFFSLDEHGRAPAAMDRNDFRVLAAYRALSHNVAKGFSNLVSAIATSPEEGPVRSSTPALGGVAHQAASGGVTPTIAPPATRTALAD